MDILSIFLNHVKDVTNCHRNSYYQKLQKKRGCYIMETRKQRIQKQETKGNGRKKIIALTTAGVLGLTAISGYAFSGMQNNKVLQKLLDEAELMVENFATNKAEEINGLNQEIGNLETAKTNLQAQLDEMTANYEEQKGLVEQANNTIAEKEAEIANLTEQLEQAQLNGTEKDELIANLNQQITDLTAEKEAAEDERDEALAEIGRINQIAIDKGFQTIDEYVQHLENTLAEYEASLAEKQAQIEQLAQDLAEEEEQNAYLQSLVDNAHDESLDTYNTIAEITGNKQISEENIIINEGEEIIIYNKAADLLERYQEGAYKYQGGTVNIGERERYAISYNNYLAVIVGEDYKESEFYVIDVNKEEIVYEMSNPRYCPSVQDWNGTIVFHDGQSPRFNLDTGEVIQ